MMISHQALKSHGGQLSHAPQKTATLAQHSAEDEFNVINLNYAKKQY